jgi:putative transposase
VFEFIDAEKTSFPIAFMCQRLGVSKAGYFAWKRRPPSSRAVADARIGELIHQIHAGSRGTYGAPRIHAELADEHGVHCGRKRVARLMRIAQLRGVCRRRRVKTTRRDEQAQLSDDLVQRQVNATQPNALWISDSTYLPTWQGFLYLAVVIDAWSRRVVGWSMAPHLRTELVLDALEMALTNRRPPGLLCHSDRGSQGGFNRWSQQRVD